MTTLLQSRFETLREEKPWRATGKVARVTAHELEVRGLRLKIGDALAIRGADATRQAEVIALTPDGARVLPYGEVSGIGKGDAVVRESAGLSMNISDALVGRVVVCSSAPAGGRLS